MAIVEVLKFDSNANIFAWKYPNSELSTWTQLIVAESQEAILVKNGQISDVFGPGRYVLSTDNIPILQSLINIPFGGKSPFSAEVWFINKAFSLDIKWGTSSPIQIQDPKYKVFVPVRAFGQFGIQIEDSKKFLTKLVGTMKFFNKDTLTSYFRGLYITRVKDAISSCLVESQISLLEINAHLNEISKMLGEQLSSQLSDFGISVVSFYVNDINVPENDSAVKQLKAALAKRAEMDIIGYSYQQERTFNTLESAADNNGAASAVIGSGIGLGMGFGIGGAIGSQAQSLTQAMGTVENKKDCPNCNAKIGESIKFCPECGYNTQGAPKSISCPNCGCSLTPGAKFCPECGKKISLCSQCGSALTDDNTCPNCGAKKCPNCSNILEKEAKFCSQCGFTLIKRCPNCNETVEQNEKFCSNCGTKLIE